ncbi:MAG TPA: hypothetical protein VGO18_28105 [Steroidobacteraceae bacterium]|nr:hypothetical protein [Steroidobacteraceae bacterium]
MSNFIEVMVARRSSPVVLLLYLEQAIAATRNDGLALTSDMLVEGIREDAVLRVRPKAMTVAVIVARRLR